jgi:hypothetical protein
MQLAEETYRQALFQKSALAVQQTRISYFPYLFASNLIKNKNFIAEKFSSHIVN